MIKSINARNTSVFDFKKKFRKLEIEKLPQSEKEHLQKSAVTSDFTVKVE